jgi:SHS2 domain-containing protein
VEARVAVEGTDAADLLVHWLNTALLEAELRRALWTEVEVTAWSETSLAATLRGPKLDPRRQAFLREIKAVSHHGAELQLARSPCRCRLVLDV